MDFTLGEELEEVRGLARQIFTDYATADRLRAAEQSESGVDDGLWKALGDAGLLGIALPEEDGGAGTSSGAEVAASGSSGSSQASCTSIVGRCGGRFDVRACALVFSVSGSSQASWTSIV